jgi:hypothetical protein
VQAFGRVTKPVPALIIGVAQCDDIGIDHLLLAVDLSEVRGANVERLVNWKPSCFSWNRAEKITFRDGRLVGPSSGQ